jgi:hypothetical protein
MTELYPTLVVVDGPLAVAAGQRVAHALPADRSGWRELPASAATSAIDEALDGLMRVARPGQRAGPRLDLWLLADRAAPHTEPLAAQVQRLADRVAARLGAVFPAGLPPEQRAVALHVVVAVPALDRGAAPVFDELRALLAAPLAHPVLARVWLCAQRAPGGVLSDDDLTSGVAGLLLALSFSGLREHEAVRARMSHPAGGEGPVCLAALAVQDLPLARIRGYARARAAWEALSTLRRRTLPQGHATASADRSVPGWQLEGWLAPLLDGGPAKAWREAAGRGDAAAAEHAARAVDEAERLSLGGIDAAVRAVLSSRIGHAHPLEQLPELEQALDAEQRRAEASWGADASGPPPSPAAPGPLVVTAAPTALAPHRAPLAAAAGALTTAAALAWLAAPPAPVVGMSATVITSTAPPPTPTPIAGAAWLAGAAVAAIVAWSVGRQRPASPQEATSPVARLDPEPRLRQARSRVRRAALLGVARMRERMAVLRAGLDHARAQVAAALDHVGARPDGNLEADLVAVLGPAGALHDHLLSPVAVAAWIQRGRTRSDPEAWADELAVRTWPADGLIDDVPAVDVAQVDQVAADQVAPLDTGSPFEEEGAADEAAVRAVDFLARVATALQRPVTPTGALGDPAAGVRPGDALVIVPVALRAAIDSGLRRDGVPLPAPLASPSGRPAVVVARTWEGLELAAVARGAGVP